MPEREDPAAPRIDVHVHLAGVGTQGSGCWVSPRFRRRPTFLGLRLAYRIGPEQMRTTVDQDWAAMIARLTEQGEIDYAVVLGFDGVYRADGSLDEVRSQMIVPPRWVFEVCERYRNLLPAPSINPHRADAMDLLDEAIERGAVIIKWLPIVQAIDPWSRRVRPFLQCLADAGIPLLIHAGTGEITFKTVAPQLTSVEVLEPPLEAGVSVVCAHAGRRIHLSREPDESGRLQALMERFPRLWVDNSGLANTGRFAHLPRLASDPLIRERVLHGSDFPVPTSSVFYTRRVGAGGVMRIERERNAIQRDLLIKRALGFPEQSFTRASRVLANLDRWVGR